MVARGKDKLQYGEEDVDLGGVEQLVEVRQDDLNISPSLPPFLPPSPSSFFPPTSRLLTSNAFLSPSLPLPSP